ncbi:MAG: IMP dehydrogenase [Thermodesulfobacteriota bacterium]
MTNIPPEAAYSFDDVLLVPNYSDVLPSECDTRTQLTKEIRLNVPVISAAMDTVTESETAISMAREGGIGIIHRNITADQQAVEVDKVKKSESGMIVDPVTISPEKPVSEVFKLMSKYKISGVPVVDSGKLVGIITNRDLRFENNPERLVKEVMTKDHLVKVREGITLEESKAKLHEYRIEKLLVVDANEKLTGMITIKDIEKIKKYPYACKDSIGRLRVGAAIGVGEEMMERVDKLVDAGADVLCIDTSHGHSKNVIDSVKMIKEKYPEQQVIAGNVATAKGAEALVEAGVDAIKIGIGPGSICTTRIVAGVGVPQLTAIMNCRSVSKKTGVPLIADGGIKFSGDLVKAIGAGANCVMLGSLLAGTEESPGDTILYQGRTYKAYRGMGSIEAMKAGSKDRYYLGDNDGDDDLIPEGIVGRVPYKGTIAENINQLTGGIKAGMGYVGARTIEELREKARFVKISPAGLRESHVHDVIITQEAPNYRLD